MFPKLFFLCRADHTSQNLKKIVCFFGQTLINNHHNKVRIMIIFPRKQQQFNSTPTTNLTVRQLKLTTIGRFDDKTRTPKW